MKLKGITFSSWIYGSGNFSLKFLFNESISDMKCFLTLLALCALRLCPDAQDPAHCLGMYSFTGTLGYSRVFKRRKVKKGRQATSCRQTQNLALSLSTSVSLVW